jgi:hypothetical protein
MAGAWARENTDTHAPEADGRTRRAVGAPTCLRANDGAAPRGSPVGPARSIASATNDGLSLDRQAAAGGASRADRIGVHFAAPPVMSIHQLVRMCAWCQGTPVDAAGRDDVTHTLCEPCSEKLFDLAAKGLDWPARPDSDHAYLRDLFDGLAQRGTDQDDNAIDIKLDYREPATEAVPAKRTRN